MRISNYLQVYSITLSCRLQVNLPYDIPELRRRLIPYGAYVPFRDIPCRGELDALATRLHINSSTSERQKFLELLPLPVQHTSRGDLPARVSPVTVISSDGRGKPITFGLTIEEVNCSSVTSASELLPVHHRSWVVRHPFAPISKCTIEVLHWL